MRVDRAAIESAVRAHNLKTKAAPSPVHKSEWVDPGAAPKCLGCTENFGYLDRKFNCRQCGRVFCSSCSAPHPVAGYPDKVRVCKSCTILLQHSDPPTPVAEKPSSGPGKAMSKRLLSSVTPGFMTPTPQPTKHESLMPQRPPEELGAPLVESMVPKDLGDRLSYACVIVSFLSTQYVSGYTPLHPCTV